MSASNWAGGNNPEQMNDFRANNLDLNIQIGLGLPVQLVNFPIPAGVTGNCSNRGGRRDGRQNFNHRGNRGLEALGYPGNQHNILPNRPSTPQQTVDGIPIRKVYVTNININVQHQDMYEIFCQFGRIINVFLSFTKNDSQKKFAFVTFADPLSAAWALITGKVKDILNRTMFIAAADSWHQPKEGPDGRLIWDTRTKVQLNQQESDEEDQPDAEEASDQVVEPVQELPKEEGLNMLNDDCLLHIFSFLSLKQLVGVERVCKRWQGLSFRVWRCLRELKLSHPRHNHTQYSTPVLREYLRRCGEKLSILDLAVHNHSFDDSTLAVVGQYCTNLEELKVKNIGIGKRTLAHLARSCPKLTKLNLQSCGKFNDSDLMSLLPKCEALIELELSQCGGVTGKALSTIRGPVETLRINYCASLDQNHLIKGIQNIKQTLRSLTVSTCSLHSGQVEKLVAAAPALTHLCLSRTFVQATPHTLLPLRGLTQLTSLDLTLNSAVNDKVLEAISYHCVQLTQVNLSSSGGGCGSKLSENGLSLLGHLKQLTDLDISYLEATNASGLKTLTTRNPRLKRLICRGCPELNDAGACQVVTVCNDLELFDLSGCGTITNVTVRAADTSCKMRTKPVSLRLVLGGTDIREWQEEWPAPFSQLLTIDMNDLCEETLRPDFIDDMFFPPSDSEEDDDLDHLCCDCDFDFDDLYDPTLFPHDDDYDTPKFGDYDDVESPPEWRPDFDSDEDESSSLD